MVGKIRDRYEDGRVKQRLRELTPEMLLKAYSLGIFPMAEKREDDTIYWIDPETRGIIPLHSFHISHSLRHALRHDHYRLSVNQAFMEIIAACAASRPGRRETWINHPIEGLCIELHRMGFAHSVEVWRDKELIGGLYGIALGGVFFGESMVSMAENASKIALVELVARLKAGGYGLLDTQFVTSHLAQFGAIEVPREQYRQLLKNALPIPAHFPLNPEAHWASLF